MNSTTDIVLHKDAVALRPVRILHRNKKDAELRLYTAITFSVDPWNGCKISLWRCFLFGRPDPEESDVLIDVLNNDGDIIQDFAITIAGFEYLRRTLKFVVASEEPD